MNLKLIALFGLLASCSELTYAQSVCVPGCVTPTPTPTPTNTPTPSPIPTSTPTPTSTPLPTRPFVSIPAGGDVVSILNAAKAGTLYQLAANAFYSLASSISISASHVTLDLNGATLSFNTPPGVEVNISIHASFFELMNGKIVKANRLLEGNADHLYIHNLVVSGAAQLYIDQHASAPFTKLDQITFAQGNYVIVYYTSDNVKISNSKFGSPMLPCSTGEYCIRSEIANGHIPSTATIQNVTAYNGNTFHKDVIGIRMGSATIDNCLLSNTTGSGIRIGQIDTPNVALGGNNPLVTVSNTQFLTPSSPQLSVDQGAIVVATGNTFVTSNGDMRSVSVSVHSKVTLTNNIQKLTASGFVPKSLWNPALTPASSTVVETGTKIVGP